MTRTAGAGADLACRALEAAGVRHVFGLPGTQNVPLFEALRRSRLRVIQATHELAATMMACGYGRTTGLPGVVAAIQGPGLAWAVAGLLEARDDSTPLLLVTGTPASSPGRTFQLQAWDQATSLGPVVKRVLRAERPEAVPGAVASALTIACSGEPGPVVLELAPEALTDTAEVELDTWSGPPLEPEPGALADLSARLAASRRPLLLAGQGVRSAAALRELAERIGAPVATTLSARGSLPEDHPLSFGVDLGLAVDAVSRIAEKADLILALGWKGTHNGTGGFRLHLPADRLVHVDASPEVLGANYPAALGVVADAALVLEALVAEPRSTREGPGWAAAELAAAREAARQAVDAEPRFAGLDVADASGFFAALRKALPRDAILVTDSGLHQALARRHFAVHAPGGFLAPSDFQSMGFGLPAGIGASLAAPDRRVVVLTGDGGFAMVGAELVTAVREGLPLTVLVFNDGHLGLIRRQQLREYGHAHAVAAGPMDYGAFAQAVGAGYRLLEGPARVGLEAALAVPGPTLVEVVLGDSGAMDALRARGAARAAARRALPKGFVGWLRRRLG
ncbi:MAG TPA: thiamine pyrophosphate-binding protein [Gemmatimonadales bacterium]|nr:thiamine pyrophosphate-binding protein [Gemmatimonadales bacterium]